jgi:cytochrome c oxidase assembly protein Cox11
MNPMPAVRSMIERFRSQAEAAGFKLERGVVAPGEPDTLEVVMIVDEDLFKDPEQRAIDEQFKEMEKQLKKQERAERARASEETKTSLEEWLDG